MKNGKAVEVAAPRGGLAGTVAAIPSKSHAHRALICAVLSETPSRVVCAQPSADILATVSCLRALGADITADAGGFKVIPIQRESGSMQELVDLPCGESGTTLRLLLPVVGALGRSARFHREGRLAQRPLSPLYEELVAHGCQVSDPSVEPLTLSGQLEPGVFSLAGSVSSQFISGLLLAFPLLAGPSELQVVGTLESRPYVDMTMAALRDSGIEVTFDGEVFCCAGSQTYQVSAEVIVEGDWSNAAFWLCAGALGERPVTVTGLAGDSLQGDRAILEILRRFGARVEQAGDAVTTQGGALQGIEIDAHDIPDLVPALAVVAAATSGQTVITGAARLRLKESDRLAAVCDVLGRLGADVKETGDGLLIQGGQRLHAATVDAWGDHRIAMMAAIASLWCEGPVTITGADAVSKSYPQFFEDLEALGGKVNCLDPATNAQDDIKPGGSFCAKSQNPATTKKEQTQDDIKLDGSFCAKSQNPATAKEGQAQDDLLVQDGIKPDGSSQFFEDLEALGGKVNCLDPATNAQDDIQPDGSFCAKSQNPETTKKGQLS